MKYPVIVVPFLKVSGMALYPFILVGHKDSRRDKVLINHEKIHLKQQAELLVIPFYIAYLINYLFNIMRYRQHHYAYRHILFEQEAYWYEADFTYLQRRKHCNWLNFCKS